MRFLSISKYLEMICFIPLVIIFHAFSSCEAEVDKQTSASIIEVEDVSKLSSFGYNLSEPFAEHKLGYELKEISGLDYDDDLNQLIAVNDEVGTLFFLNPRSGEVLKKESFGLFGDFEGVEKVKDKYYVSRSDGAILVVDLGNNGKVTRRDTRLDYTNNVEGIAYDPFLNGLLLSCKDVSAIPGSELKKGKAVYLYELETMTLDTTTYIRIKDSDLIKWAEKNHTSLSKKKKTRIKSFSPSGIAIHPLSNEVYITSAKGDLLVVVNRHKGIQHIELFNKKMEQVEGICFSKSGDLFLSSEGKIGAATIFAFHPSAE